MPNPNAATLNTVCSFVIGIAMTLINGQIRAAEATCCTETELTYLNGEVELSAVLLTPIEDGEFPAAVLLQGAGASDRNNGWSRLMG